MAVNQVNNQKTIQDIIDSTSKGDKSRNTGELGKDDFLNLLVTQLRYQDPLKPVDDKEFIGQMAQFSALEQMQNMNSSFTSVKAFNLIGKHVTASITDEKTKETKPIEGEVTNVKLSAGKAYVVVKGYDVPVEKVTDVTDGLKFSQTNLSSYTNLIGYNADAFVYDAKTGDIVSVNGVVKSVSKGLNENYAVMDGNRVEITKLITTTPSTDRDFQKKYLQANEGKEIEVELIDKKSGDKVIVKGTLEKGSWSIAPNGRISATLNNLYVPVDSISNVVPVQQESNQEKLLKQILEKLSSQEKDSSST